MENFKLNSALGDMGDLKFSVSYSHWSVIDKNESAARTEIFGMFFYELANAKLYTPLCGGNLYNSGL